MSDVHTWFKSRVVSEAAGLLDPPEEERFREHRISCESCRELHEAFQASGAPEWDDASREERPAGHLSPAILARWSRADRHLAGIELELARAHAERCPECREELRFLGALTALDNRPESDAAPGPGALDPGEATRAGPSRRPGTRGKPRRTFVPWLAGGLAGAAAAALLALLLQPDPPIPGGLVPWGAPAEVRGETTITLSRGGRVLVLAVPPPGPLLDAPGAVVEVLGPEGERYSRNELDAAALSEPTLVLLVASPDPLPEGNYAIVFRSGTAVAPGDEIDRREVRVRVGR